MTDFDLDRLGDVWRQDPDPAEMAALKQTAEAVARRARREQIADTGFAAVVSIAVLVLALSNPRPATLLAGVAAILLMLGSSIRQRQLRAHELKSLTGSAEDMLDQSILRLKATIKRTWIGFVGAPFGILLGVGFGSALENSGSRELAEYASLSKLNIIVMAASIALLIGLFLHAIRRLRRTRQELERLVALREVYRRESEIQ